MVRVCIHELAADVVLLRRVSMCNGYKLAVDGESTWWYNIQMVREYVVL